MKKNNLILILAIVSCMLLVSIDSEAKFDLNTVKTQGEQAGTLMMTFVKYAVNIVGLLGAAVSGYNIFAKGQNSWQYISAFIMCIVILGLGLTMFSNINN